MEQQYQEELLDNLNHIYGLNNHFKNTILNYTKYLKLLKEDKIKDLCNANIVIRCPDDIDTETDKLVDLLVDILKHYNITTNECYYINKRELKSNNAVSFIKNKIIVIDTIKMYTTLYCNLENVRRQITLNNDKVFIVIASKDDAAKSRDYNDILAWFIKLELPDRTYKQQYIKSILEKNDITVATGCNFIERLAQGENGFINEWLLTIVIDCKINNVSTITNKYLSKFEAKIELTDLDTIDVTNEKSSSKSALQQLDALIGLDDVKKQIHQIVNYVKVNKNRGTMPMLHMSFEGPAGSGKNEIARLVGQIFKEENILSSGQFIEVSRADLVAGYVGQTALKTQDVIGRAKGGVLFIDEAYSLDSRDSDKDYGTECISTLIKAMEDYRDNLCVILAGYTQDMEQLLKSNRGFSSRIQFRLKFNDYTADELYKIFKKMLQDDGYKLSANIRQVLVEHFNKVRLKDDFGNGRYARSLFEKIKFEQADRCATDAISDANVITRPDVINVVHRLELDIPKAKNRIGFAM